MINPGTHTITNVSEPRVFSTKYGEMNSFTVKIEGDEGTYEMARPVTRPAPTVGQRIDVASVDDTSGGKYPPKLRLAQANRAPQGGMTPQRESQIIRQSAQKAAIQWAALAHERGKLPDDFKLSDLTPMIEWFVADTAKAKA